MKLAPLSLTAKLAAINLLLVAALLAVVAVAWRHLPSADEASEAALLARAQRATQNADMMHDALRSDVLAALLAAQRSAPEGERNAVQKSLRDNAQEFRSELQALATMPLGRDTKRELDAAHEAGMAYVDQAEQLVREVFLDERRAMDHLPAFDQAFERAKAALAAQTDRIARLLDAASAASERATAEARRWLLIAALGTVLGAGIGVALIARSIRRSLIGLSAVAREVAAGHLERRSEVRGRDEVGELAASVNQMADTLHEMIERMRADAERAAFGAHLTAALDMADSEVQAHQVVERAMRQIAADHPMELLLADSSDAHLERAAAHPDAGAPGCGVDSPFSCVAVRRGHTVHFAHSGALDACPKLRDRGDAALAATCVPVTFMGRAMGVLHAAAPADRALGADAAAHMATLGTQVGARIGTVRAFERTQLQASTDALTGLGNRRHIEARLRDLLRSRQQFAFVMADLDHFKRLNDTHGHQAGDEALRAFADAVRDTLRAEDAVARWGGEEFAFVLMHADAASALQWVDRLRAHLAQVLQRRSAPAFTASFGVADSSFGPPLEAVLAAADRALYRAKSDGRDRGVLADRSEAALTRVSEQRAALDVPRLVAAG